MADSGDIELGVGAKPLPSLAAAFDAVTEKVEGAARAIAEAGQAEERDLAAVAAQVQAAAEAADNLRQSVEAARAAGAPVSPETEARLRATAEHVAALQKRLAAIPPAVEPISPALVAAEAAATRFAEAVEEGGRGAGRALSIVNVAIDDLRAEIERLRAGGQPVAALEARLAELRKEVDAGTVRFGRYRAAARDAEDALKGATRGAGEFEGQLSSLEDVASVLSPRLGNVVGRITAIAGGIGIAVIALKTLIEWTEKAGKAGAAELEDHLADLDAQIRLSSGETTRYAQNLRDVLRKNGYDVAADGVDELIAKEAELQQRLVARVAATKDLVASLGGDTKKLQDSTAVVLGAVGELLSKAGIGLDLTKDRLEALVAAQESAGDRLARPVQLNTQLAQALVAALDEELARYRDLGREAPENLEKVRTALAVAARADAEFLEAHEKLLAAVGVKSEAEFFEAARQVRDYAGEIERSGTVSAESAALIVQNVDRIRAAQAQLPADQREHTAAMLASLEELQEGYRTTAAVALAALGVQTPDAVRRAAGSVQTLASAFGPLAQVTKEQADKVRDEALKILESIALLPAAQRAGVADITKSLQVLVAQYGTAAEKQKAFAVDVAEVEKATLAKRREALETFAETFASTLDGLLSRLDQAKADLAAAAGSSTSDLQKELVELRKLQDQGPISSEQQARINEIETALLDAGAGAARFASGLDDASDAGGRVVASAGEMDGVLRGLLGSLRANQAAWNSLGIETRNAIETQISQLQAAGNQGFATADLIRGVFGTVRDILQGAGGDVRELEAQLGEAAGGTVDLNAAFADLDRRASAANLKLGELTKATDAGATSQQKLQEEAKETAKAVSEMAKEAAASVQEVAAGFGEWRAILAAIGPLLVDVTALTKELRNASLGDPVPEAPL
jgi:hypothetical protein